MGSGDWYDVYFDVEKNYWEGYAKLVNPVASPGPPDGFGDKWKCWKVKFQGETEKEVRWIHCDDGPGEKP